MKNPVSKLTTVLKPHRLFLVQFNRVDLGKVGLALSDKTEEAHILEAVSYRISTGRED
ncbi:hypothetical protein [Roseobacter sp. HKCCD7870]|uniref:hypothetical protein n=1 Tax=Roseobacter sp. HKCCD7870 TaxID=3120343 RepID=UPI0030EE6E7C